MLMSHGQRDELRANPSERVFANAFFSLRSKTVSRDTFAEITSDGVVRALGLYESTEGHPYGVSDFLCQWRPTVVFGIPSICTTSACVNPSPFNL